MNAPAPGWNPDPTGRHEYRYWDGTTWTDDVSDSGTTSVDPIGTAPPAATGPQDATQPLPGPPTASFDAGPTQSFGAQPTQAFGSPPGPPGFGAPPGGQVPAAPPRKSGPSTGLIVALAALAVALIVGVAVVATSGGDDDDDTATENTSDSSDDTSGDDTSGDDTSGDDSTGDDMPSDLDDLDDLDIGDDMSEESLVELLALGMEMEADGKITSEQAQCAAQAIVDHFGSDALLESAVSGEDPFEAGTTEDQVAVAGAMLECIPADVLAEIGMSESGG